MASQTKIAQQLGINYSTFKGLITRGIVEERPTGQYSYEECSKQYLDHLRKVAANHMTADGLDLQAERARLAKEQADQKEMENAVERGDLVYINDIVKQFEDQLQKAKVKVLAVPTKVAAEVHAAKEVKECKEIIEEAVKEALSELVGYHKEAPSEEA